MQLEVQQIILCGEFTVKPGTVLGPRELNEYEIVLFPNPSATVYRCKSGSYSLGNPSIIVTPPGETHTYLFDPARPIRHLFTHFILSSDEIDESSFLAVQALDSPSIIPHIFRHMLWLIHERSEGYKERTQQLLASLLMEYVGMAKSKADMKPKALPPKIVQTLRMFESNLGNRISISDIAHAVGWSPEHLSRNISASLGVSPQKVVRQIRIRRACQLLRQSDLTIGQIAQAVGFEDENYFCRVFRQEKNMTATEFRNLYSDPRYLYVLPEDDFLSPYPINQYFW